MAVDSRLMPIGFVADDDVPVRKSLEVLILTAGRRSKVVASAAAFVAPPRVDVPGCLVVDVSLPDLNGLELHQRRADDRLDMPIIFHHGLRRGTDDGSSNEAGAVELLTKPLNDAVLLSATGRGRADSLPPSVSLPQQTSRRVEA